MASPSTPPSSTLQKGTYATLTPNSLRSACPILNAFANHGLIPRDGRSVRASELDAAMRDLGLSITVRKTLIWGSFIERRDEKPTGAWGWVQWQLGIRDHGQYDSEGVRVMDLDQLSKHNAIEHDGSLTRRDDAQGDNCSMQKDLVRQLLEASSDEEDISTDDFSRLRRKRTEQQRKENEKFRFPWGLEYVTAGEIAATQRVFGDANRGYAIPVGWVKALFEEERLPVEEGWKRRSGLWGVGMLEVLWQLAVVKVRVGRTSQTN
ncbi:MAG: hypothetical protein Q9218_005001 [Villophora microphyllina]